MQEVTVAIPSFPSYLHGSFSRNVNCLVHSFEYLIVESPMTIPSYPSYLHGLFFFESFIEGLKSTKG